jgi:SAM-dependent methyltransferase
VEQHEIDAERAIQLGHPSYVWRAGQERRLGIVREHVALEGQCILDIGCGLGMYAEAFRRYSPHVYGVEVELARARCAVPHGARVAQAVGEAMPFPSNTFDVVYNHEVLEHVADHRQVVREAVRVARPGGHVVTYAPNRLWPFETHGIFWRGTYRFGNVPFVNYLPDALRSRLAPHVRAYTKMDLLGLFRDLPVRICTHRTVYPGFDNVIHRCGRAGALIRAVVHALEAWPLVGQFGLSHFLVAQKTASQPS